MSQHTERDEECGGLAEGVFGKMVLPQGFFAVR